MYFPSWEYGDESNHEKPAIKTNIPKLGEKYGLTVFPLQPSN